MSKPINDGGPAFPVPDSHCPNGQVQYGSYGMSLRDYFAGQALQALVARDEDDSAYGDDMIKARPQLAYEYADAMLAARNQKGGQA